MLYSNERKQALSGWLQDNEPKTFNNSLKLQKYLLFYELFSKVNDYTADLSSLEGWERGPVFSSVWGDYTHDSEEFRVNCSQVYNNHKDKINSDFARQSAFLCNSLTDDELSELTHQLHLWSAKKNLIEHKVKGVDLEESDFNTSDAELIKTIQNMYPISLIDNTSIEEIRNNYFIISNDDKKRLSAEHYQLLWSLTNSAKLHNPVYVEIDEEGRLLID